MQNNQSGLDQKVGKIMIVDDNPENLRTLKAMLEGQGYETLAAISGELALESLNEVVPDLIFLDVMMPGLDGYEVCERIKKIESLKKIPIIFISALTETFNKVKSFKTGAVDYVVKPFEVEEVIQRVKIHLRLYWQMQEIEAFNLAMVNREMRIVELKKEINSLLQELGRNPKYQHVQDEIN